MIFDIRSAAEAQAVLDALEAYGARGQAYFDFWQCVENPEQIPLFKMRCPDTDCGSAARYRRGMDEVPCPVCKRVMEVVALALVYEIHR